MEAARQKKLRSAKVVATNIFMGIAVLVIVGVLILLAMGYTFSRDGGLKQSGLLQVGSVPAGATVEIDDEVEVDKTEMSKMLAVGEHQIVISKPGYDTWRRSVETEAGLLTRVDWARLFPIEREVTDVQEFEKIQLMSASPDRRYIFVLPAETREAWLFDTLEDTVTYRKLDMAVALDLKTGVMPATNWEVAEWSTDSSRILLKQMTDDVATWVLMDTKDEKNSVQLSEHFEREFMDVRMGNAAANRLWTLEATGALRLINTRDLTISGILMGSVEQITAHDSGMVAYVRTDQEEGRMIGVYREGDRAAGRVVQKISQDAQANLVLGDFWGDNWLAFALDDQLYVRGGQDLQEEMGQYELRFPVAGVTTSPSERLIAVLGAKEKKVSVLDLELGEFWTYGTDSEWSALQWLDDFLSYEVVANKLVVRDFDGFNRREIGEVAEGLPVMIPRNNRWLYFASGSTLQRQRL